MLLTSARRAARLKRPASEASAPAGGSPSAAASLPEVSPASKSCLPAEGLQVLQPDQVAALAATLRGWFVGRAMSEKLWNGTYLELAEAHQEFLRLWYKQPPTQVGSARKVWATAFPSLDKGQESTWTLQ